ncbi:MAG: AI-2E family transporter [Geminicoccaceae bacterium]
MTPNSPAPISITPAAAPMPATSMVAVAAGVIGALYLGAAVFVPLALAILVSFALAPVTNRLKKWGLGKIPAVLVVVTLALGLAGGFVYLLVGQAVGLAQNLPRYEQNLRDKIHVLGPTSPAGSVFEQTADLLRRMTSELDKVTTADAGKAATGGSTPPAPIPVQVLTPPSSPLLAIVELARLVAEPLATMGIMLLFIIFVLIERENLRDRFIRLFGATDMHRATEAMNEAGSRLGRYLLMQLLINVSYGTLFGLALFAIGVPNAQLWGLLGMVLRFIPYVGAPISLLFPLGLTLAADSGWAMPLYTLLAFIAIETTCAYVLEPYLFGASTGLSRVALIAATAFWTVLWGPIGLLLAAPLTACLVVMGRYVPQLQFLEVLLGNQQVLSPELKVYQRLLANDTDEAADVVEEHADAHGLVETVDQVLLPVLALVAQDRQRGVLEREQLQALADGIAEIAQDLAGAPDPDAKPDPAARPAGRRALCVGAGSILDDVAAHLVAHGLAASGLLAEALSPVPGRRVPEIELPTDGSAALLVVAVGPRSGGRARRLVRRLRERFGPDQTVLVGLWARDDMAEALPATTEAEPSVASVTAAASALTRTKAPPSPAPAPAALAAG